MPCPLVCSYVPLAASACVDGVLLPLLAAGLVEALGMMMSKVQSCGGCCGEPGSRRRRERTLKTEMERYGMDMVLLRTKGVHKYIL